MTERPPDDEPVVVRWAPDEFSAGVTAARLDDAGILARVVTDDPSGSSAYFGATATRRVAVLVPSADVERARALIAEHPEEGIDWDDVDVGEPEDNLARAIASDRPDRRTWWWGGWPASIILLVAGFLALWFSAQAAMVIWLAAAIAAIGSGLSWIASRLRRTDTATLSDD